MGASVELASLTKQFAGMAAVHRLSLKLHEGEFLTLLGPSGSGKTTTLNMLAGFVAPDSGDVFIDDEPVTNLPPYRRNLGMSFQNYALFPHMTVNENVAFPLEARGWPGTRVEQAVAQALELVELTRFADRYPAELSGGEQQRVAFARALVFKPRVLLMDEPLGALDRQLRERMQIELRRVQRKLGITTIAVTHDQEEALVMSDRIALMNHGRLVQLATPRELYSEPANRFVAEFVGESNLLPVVIEASDERECIVRSRRGAIFRMAINFQQRNGTGTTLMFRPEDLVLAPSAGDADVRELGVAEIEEILFAGPSAKVNLRLISGDALTARWPAELVTQCRTGERVQLGWRHQKSKLLRDD